MVGGDVVRHRAVAIVQIVSVTGTQCRNLAIWTSTCAFVAVPPNAAVASSRSKLVGMLRFLDEEDNAMLRPIGFGWRLLGGSVYLPVP